MVRQAHTESNLDMVRLIFITEFGRVCRPHAYAIEGDGLPLMVRKYWLIMFLGPVFLGFLIGGEGGSLN